ncbi:MAG: hypothetical protein ACFCVG_19565 [Kineosporiaceae bacterium]
MDGTDDPGADGEHEWVARLLAADAPGPIPAAVAGRVEDSLRAAAGVTQTGERPRVFGGSAPARPSPFDPAGTRPTTGSTTGPGPGGRAAAGLDDTGSRPAGAGRRPGSRRGRRQEAAEARRHLTLYRALPVAAGVVVLGVAVTVVANLAGGEEDAGDEAAVVSQPAEAPATAGPPPNGLVSTGTAYTEDGLADQALALVAAVATGDARSVAPAPDTAEGGAEEAEAGAAVDPTGPLASAAGFRACAQGLGAPEGTLPVAVDLATYEGTDVAVVVLPNRAGDGYEVIVTDRACDPGSQRTSTTVLAP